MPAMITRMRSHAALAALAVVSATLVGLPAQHVDAAATHAVPPPPANVSAISGNGSAIVTWSDPTGGAVPVTAYIVTPYRGNKADRPRLFSAKGRNATVTGLPNGASFRFKVAAKNAIGSGPQSAGSNVVTVGTPGLPTGVRATTLSPQSMRISFAVPPDNGAVIVRYAVTCKSANGGTTTTAVGATSPITVKLLTLGKTYACTVVAFNSRGKGTRSGPSVTTLTQPVGVTAEPGVGNIIVSWKQLPASGVTYVVSSSPAGAGCRVVDADSCNVPVTDPTPRRFSVTANDLSGASPASARTGVLHHRLLLVVAGQSNAVGTESYAVDPVTFNDYFGVPNVNGADSQSTITWVPSSHGGLLPEPASGVVGIDTPQMLDTDAPVRVFGPEIGLARKLFADTGQPVTIVKAAIGSTSLAVDWDPATADGYYLQMLNQVRAAMESDANTGTFDTIGGFYWYQGEDDVANPAWAAAYQDNLTAFIGRLRRDLPLNAGAPIVLAKESLAARIALRRANADCPGDICSTLEAGDNAVRAADDWAAANLPHVVTVDTFGLARSSSLIHLSNLGELALGSALAVASETRFPGDASARG